MKRFLHIARRAALLLLLAGLNLPAAELPASGQHVFYLGEERVVVLRFQIWIDGQPYTSVWQSFLDKRFKELDADSNGVLSSEEARGMPSQNLLAQMGLGTPTASTASQLAAPSATSDGQITREEFAAHFRRLGLDPFRMRIDSSTALASRGGIVLSRAQAADAAPRVLFEKLDADSDGALISAEFLNALHALRKLDLDRDGSISSSELVQTPNLFATPAPQANPSETPKPKFLAPSQGQPLRQLAQQMLAARDGHAGGVKDNRLSFDELGLSAERLSPFDADGDAALDFEETQQLLGSPPNDVQLLVRLGKRAQGEQALEYIGESPGRVSSDLASLTLGKVQMEFAPQPYNGTFRQSYLNTFKAADQDSNGYLEAMEGQRFGINPAMFALLDADKDGKLFEKEYLHVMESLSEMESSRIQLDVSDRGRDLFRILDTNSDGRLGPREFEAAVSRMAGWDTNRDDKVAANELPQQFRFSLARGAVNPSGRTIVFAAATRAAPGVRPQQSGGPAWFVKMDRNSDGDVSQREFLGPADVFARLDADANGLLDAREALAAKSP